MLHQQGAGSWDANHSWGNPGLASFKRVLVGGDHFKSSPAISRERFGQWLGNVIHWLKEESSQSLFGQEVWRPAAFLFLGESFIMQVSLPQVWLVTDVCISWCLKIEWTTVYFRALGRWPSDN